MLKFVLASIFLHLAVFTFLSVRHRPPANTFKPPIEVSLQLPPKVSHASRSNRLATGRANSGGKIFKFHRPLTPEFSTAQSENSPSSSGDWTQNESYLSNDMNRFDGLDMSEAKYVSRLWTEINEAIYDSPLFKEYGHTGDIYLRFEVTESGKIHEPGWLVKSDNQILKVVAARSIRKALSKENLDMFSPGKVMTLFAHFQWSDKVDCHDLAGLNKNYLSFCRISSRSRKDFSGGEKAGTYLKSLNYGFGALEEIRKYKKEQFRRETGFDPFQEIKRDPDWNLGT